ncbi:GNAT family N-acetyltransferase [Kitasatospora sp. NPDC050543]|uniref:bifunctional acetate--CoA ligase family protein/GNAT family N-acetyltransferase n=1 Tax=Kitasatospora sp. NPDC050543 TaxID=3364054 RepID=UPI0037930B14
MPTTEYPPPTAEALLADGTTAIIRPLGPADRDAVLELHSARMSEASRRLRFFGVSRRAPELAADRLCGPPRPGLLALGAWVGADLIGEADCETTDGRADTAELALAVADTWQHHGVGTLLVEHLVHAARERGIRELEADTLVGNRAVHKLFSDLGLPVHRHLDQGELKVRVPLDENDEHYREAVDERGRAAGVASLTALLRPRSIAVIGASRRSGSVGQAVLLKIREGGFTGELWAVNPYADEVAGEPAFPDLSSLPGTPDLAVLAVPPVVVPGAAQECGLAGVRALVVLTSNLDGGQARQLMHACRRHSMRLVGPNSLGIAQTDPVVRLDAEFGGALPLPGTAGIAVQSGGVGIALLERLARLGIGVSSFVSLGDKFDVSGNDLLQWWESDGRTDLALLHLESFGNPRAFSRTARRVTRRIPVLTVDAGRSVAGRRGAASHTAAAATPTVTREALFRQAGITATRSIAELVETAALLHAQPLPRPRGNIAVLSNAGGIGILAADACAEAGVPLLELPSEQAEELLDLLPDGASTGNPVDTTAAATAEHLRACVDLLARSPAIDGLIVCLVPTALASEDGPEAIRALLEGPARRRIPVAIVQVGQEAPVRCLSCADGGTLPSYSDPAAAARALAHARDRARWLAEPHPEHGTTATADTPSADTPSARRLTADFLRSRPEGGWLDPKATADLLACYDVPLTTSMWARNEQEALHAARTLRPYGHDGRVVLKAYWPDQVHKSRAGAVRTGLATDADVRTAYSGFTTRFGARMDGAVVQPMAAPGLELLAGIVQDQVFGPLVVLGLGGTTTDILDDRSARLAPLTERDLTTMVTELRGAALLTGTPVVPPVDTQAVRHVLAALSRMAADLPQLTEADLNPLIAYPGGLICVDARVRLEPRRPFDPYLRRLRRPAISEEP